MGNPVCIDTDIIIDHLRGREPGASLYAQIVAQEIPFTTCITKFELFCGAKNYKEENIINESLLGFEFLPFDDKSSHESANIYKDLKYKGTLIGIRDIFIASIAITNSIPLVTKNIKEFKRIKGLVLWQSHRQD